MIATSTGMGLGADAHPIKVVNSKGAKCLMFIALTVFDFASVRHPQPFYFESERGIA
jgi:hypothetical protein